MALVIILFDGFTGEHLRKLLLVEAVKSWFCRERKRRKAAGQSFERPLLQNIYPDLEKQFEIDPYPTKEQYNDLAIYTGLTKQQAGFNEPIVPKFFEIVCTFTFGPKV